MTTKRKNSKRPDNDSLQGILYAIERLPDAPESQTIERILRLVTRISASTEAARLRATGELKEAIKGYRWSYLVSPTKEGLRGVLVPAYAEPTNRREHMAVRELIALIDSGEVWRIFECETCAKLGFAAAKRQRFCGPKCKQYAFDTDPANIAKKRKYMVKLRATAKDLDKRARERVGLGTPQTLRDLKALKTLKPVKKATRPTKSI